MGRESWWVIGLLHVFSAAALANLRVSEAETSIQFEAKTVAVGLAIRDVEQQFTGTVKAEWLDPMDTVLSSATVRASLPAGSSVVRLKLAPPMKTAETEQNRQLIWHRIRYSIDDGANGGSRQSGIVAVSGAQSNLFVLQLFQGIRTVAESAVPITVRAVHPVTEVPVAGVRISAQFKDEKRVFEGVTDAQGVVLLNLPQVQSEDGQSEVRITGTAGSFRQEDTSFIYTTLYSRVRIDTDKPLYKPGDTIRIRAIALGPDGRPLARKPLRISIENGRRKLFTASPVTSRFGIAAAEWTLPDNAETGSYRVTAEAEQAVGSIYGSASVEVRRYELPLFTVAAEPGKPWYVAGEQATIRVSADYTFGKPVRSGIVNVTERGHFGSPEKQGRSFSARLVDGKAEVAVAPVLNDGLGSYWAQSFYYAVRVTTDDNRTEEQATSVTMARDAINISVDGLDRVSSNLPVPIYVRTVYPDDSPAQCTVDLELETNGTVTKRRVRTSRFGTAVLDGVLAPEGGQLANRATATDGEQRTGRHESRSRAIRAAQLRIHLDKTLHRVGEPARVRIRSAASGRVYVAVLKDRAVIEFRLVNIRQGETVVEFPFREEFEGDVKFQAHLIDPERRLAEPEFGPEDIAVARYQERADLGIEVLPDKREYRPGQRANTRVRVTASGKPVEAALGIAVVDSAVMARASRWPWPKWRDSARFLRTDFETLIQDPDGEVFSAWQIRAYGEPVIFPSLFTTRADEVYRERVDRDLEALSRAVRRWKADGRDYPRTEAELQTAVQAYGVDVSKLADSWGTAYRLERVVEREWIRVRCRAAGPDREFGTQDDLVSSQLNLRWFDQSARRIAEALKTSGGFPLNAWDFRSVLEKARLGDVLRDPSGAPLLVEVSQTRLTLSDSNTFIAGQFPPKGSPVSRTVSVPQITLRLRDGDGRTGHVVASFTGPPPDDVLGALLHRPDVLPKSAPQFRGGIVGEVTDGFGGRLPTAEIEAASRVTNSTIKVKADEVGAFQLFLPAGDWVLTFTAPGFKRLVAVDVPVVDGILTGVEAQLEVGSLLEAVQVLAGNERINRNSALTAASYKKAIPPPPLAVAAGVVPLRSDFPETLTWMPLIETNRDGIAEVDFDLAGTITTWRMKAVGSTLDGRIGEQSKDIVAFQPFFVDLQPPAALTVGDEISAPIELWNYTAGPARVDTRVEARGGLQLVRPVTGNGTVAAGETARQSARVRAAEASQTAALTATARGAVFSDAIERKLAIRPNGRRVVHSSALEAGKGATLSVSIPESAMAGSRTGKLRLYPSVLSHIYGSREGLLSRPYGCAEQTISSTYPNLLLLDLLKRNGVKDAQLESAARRNLRAGYDRLLGYQDKSGGFTYFGHGAPDVALTGYAVEFLTAAARHVSTDSTVTSRAAQWLLGRRTSISSSTAAALAESLPGSREAIKGLVTLPEATTASAYELAVGLRTAVALGEKTRAEALARRLVALQAKTGEWNAGAVTPFYGWGRAGEIETVATVVNALQRAEEAGIGDPQPAIEAGLGWLLRSKDEAGVWFSTQATIKTLLALSHMNRTPALAASVAVNGKAERKITFANAFEPREVDITEDLVYGANRIEVSGANGAALTAALSASWVVPWSEPIPAVDGISVSAEFDKTEAEVNEPVNCFVTLARSHPSSRGMLIATIGLPPGAVVEREPLERLMKSSRGLWRYEVEPDRLVLYLWPQSDKLEMPFTFRLRYGMKASSGPSEVWDYYNPDFRAIAPPRIFTISER